MVDTNKVIVRRYRDIYNTHQLEALTEVLDANLISHSRLDMPGILPGLEGLKQIHGMTLAAFPDLHITTDSLIAEEDKVVEVWTQTMTHTGIGMFGAPADTGKAIRTWGISIYRIADGKIIEHWGEMDFVAVLMQLGVMPSP